MQTVKNILFSEIPSIVSTKSLLVYFAMLYKSNHFNKPYNVYDKLEDLCYFII